jgi:acyl-CoA synthetase (AMP-forming)/AMP-acid ligase II
MSSIWGGRTLVILPQFEPHAWLEAVHKERVTHSFVVPTMLKRVMDEPDFGRYDLSSLQLVAYGRPHALQSHPQGGGRFKCGLMNAYGQMKASTSPTSARMTIASRHGGEKQSAWSA